MTFYRLASAAVSGWLVLSLSGCGGFASGPFGGGSSAAPGANAPPPVSAAEQRRRDLLDGEGTPKSTIWDLFGNADDPNTTVEVNKYIWNASLDVLSFLPIESVDPFTGVIVTGYGAPPGGGRAYRATVYVQDPALDARSLKVALESRGGGAASAETQRAIEDAILTRARQLRIRDAGL